MPVLTRLSVFVIACLYCSGLAAQQVEAKAIRASDQTLINDVDRREMLYERFRNMFTGVTLRGQFTVDGKPMSNLKDEVYEISQVEKQPDGDQWIIKARIKYGSYDLTVPVPLDVKWAGETPVLTLDDLTIPAMGTFSARVVLHGNKYAGTWQHDKVGGHMFGMIEPAKKEPVTPTEEQDPSSDDGVKP